MYNINHSKFLLSLQYSTVNYQKYLKSEQEGNSLHYMFKTGSHRRALNKSLQRDCGPVNACIT